jgi:ubiquinone/menaquinone biosynthesis C-methylase UbiE
LVSLMVEAARPESIEHRWDVLYRDYPEVYDEFGSYPYTPDPLEVAADRLGLAGKTLVDVGCGSGLSTFRLARRARLIIGIDRERSMLGVAHRRASEVPVPNTYFVAGGASSLPLRAGCSDVVLGITSPLDVGEALRVLKPGGLVVRLEIPPGWYGGDLNAVIGHPTPGLDENERTLSALGFRSFDVDTVQEYGTSEHILRTYGFIFGRQAIEHLRQTGRTSIQWRFRVYTRFKPS